MQSEPIQATIPEINLVSVQNSFAALERKAIKLKLPIPTLTIGKPYWVERKDQYGNDIAVEYIDIEINGEVPVIKHWRLVAVLEHLVGGTLVKQIDLSIEIPTIYFKSASDCHHCQMYRQRNKTFLLYNSNTGKLFQVGTTCLSDFTGFDWEGWVSYYEMLFRFKETFGEESEGSFGGGERITGIPVQMVIEQSVAIIEKYGYKKKEVEYLYKISTATALRMELIDRLNKREGRYLEPTPEHKEKAKQVINWVLGFEDKPENERSSYEWSLLVLFKSGYIKWDNMGIACSAVASYQKAMEQAKIKEASKYQGKVGDKLETIVDVLNVTPFDGQFGITYLYKMVDKTGNVLTWFASKKALDVCNGIKIKGTVKQHREYNGIQQTVLTRVKSL